MYGSLCAKSVIIHGVLYISNVIQEVHTSVVAHHKLPKLLIKWKRMFIYDYNHEILILTKHFQIQMW